MLSKSTIIIILLNYYNCLIIFNSIDFNEARLSNSNNLNELTDNTGNIINYNQIEEGEIFK